MAEGEGIAGAVKRLPWWVIPLGGGGVVALVLVTRRGGGTTTIADAVPVSDVGISGSSGGDQTASMLQAIQQQEQGDIQALRDAFTATTLAQQQAQQEGADTLAKKMADQFQAQADAFNARLAALVVPITSDVTRSPSAGHKASGNKHHIDASDKAKHRKRQEKKGQVGHK